MARIVDCGVEKIGFGGVTILAADPDFNPGETTVDFRLTFDGKLLSSGSKPRPDNVHAVRRRFHPQLRYLWSISPILNISPAAREKEMRRADAFRKGNYRFVPMITREDQLFCDIKILLLRPAPHSSAIYRAGDLDGQVATLFDALSAPRHLEQLKGNENPGADEDPFYCLLEDDSLIGGISVETGVLLEATKDGIEGNVARAIVHVRASWPPKDLGYARPA